MKDIGALSPNLVVFINHPFTQDSGSYVEEKVDRLQLLEGMHSQQDGYIYELTETVTVCKGPIHG